MPNEKHPQPIKLPAIEQRQSRADAQPASIKPLEGILSGYPIVFDKRTNIGDWFYEEIDPHALDSADLSDIKVLANHDDLMIPVARHRRGKRSTMDYKIDLEGMFIEAKLDIENNTTSRALCSAVERGDIEDMSFCFSMEVEGDVWTGINDLMPVRRITKIRKIYEVSAVNDGAYPQTSISARSGATLDNAKKALDNARALSLDNEKRAAEQEAQAALTLEKQKYMFMEEHRNVS
jgi:HK97 family phage prohead protease